MHDDEKKEDIENAFKEARKEAREEVWSDRMDIRKEELEIEEESKKYPVRKVY
jgi:hypothetical protein